MPLYEYTCPKCGAFEMLHDIDAMIEKCPTCGAKAERVINGAVFKFKGSGFYETDYKRKDCTHRADA